MSLCCMLVHRRATSDFKAYTLLKFNPTLLGMFFSILELWMIFSWELSVALRYEVTDSVFKPDALILRRDDIGSSRLHSLRFSYQS